MPETKNLTVSPGTVNKKNTNSLAGQARLSSCSGETVKLIRRDCQVPLRQGGTTCHRYGWQRCRLNVAMSVSGCAVAGGERSRLRPSGTLPFDASTVCERITLILSLPIFWSLTAVRVLVPAVPRCAAAAAVQGSMHAMRTSGLYHTEPQRRSP